MNACLSTLLCVPGSITLDDGRSWYQQQMAKGCGWEEVEGGLEEPTVGDDEDDGRAEVGGGLEKQRATIWRSWLRNKTTSRRELQCRLSHGKPGSDPIVQVLRWVPSSKGWLREESTSSNGDRDGSIKSGLRYGPCQLEMEDFDRERCTRNGGKIRARVFRLMWGIKNADLAITWLIFSLKSILVLFDEINEFMA